MSFRPLQTLSRFLPGHLPAALLLVLALVGCAQKVIPVLGGGSCSTANDCNAGFECRNRICTPIGAVCSPGRSTCDGSTVITCNAEGIGFTQDVACEFGCSSGQCIIPSCMPAERRCAGNVVQKCGDDRTFQSVQICAHNCDTGTQACVGDLCPPGARQCDDGVTLKTCNTDGSAWQTTSCNPAAHPGRCVTGGSFDDNLGSFCERYACTPATLRCDGREIVRCNSDGRGEQPVLLCEHGCLNGACTMAVCEPGAERCTVDGLSRERCNDLGTAWDRQSCVIEGSGSCAVSQVGDGPVEAQCVQPICVPHDRTCSGSNWLECSDDGLALNVLATCDFGCAAATGCLGATCTAGAQRCVGNTRQTCAPDRRGFLTDEYCLAGCATDPSGTTSCNPLLCSPLDARCGADGASIEKCSADGSGWVSTPCDTSLVCTPVVCQAAPPNDICADGLRRCVGSIVQACGSSNGGATAYSTVGHCLGSCSGTGCDTAGGCRPFQLALSSGQGELVANGRSTYLVVANDLKGPDGSAVPNGVLATVWVDGATLVSTDNSGSIAGLQVPVRDGAIQFVVQAPALPGRATVGARIGNLSDCSATLALTFGSPSP